MLIYLGYHSVLPLEEQCLWPRAQKPCDVSNQNTHPRKSGVSEDLSDSTGLSLTVHAQPALVWMERQSQQNMLLQPRQTIIRHPPAFSIGLLHEGHCFEILRSIAMDRSSSSVRPMTPSMIMEAQHGIRAWVPRVGSFETRYMPSVLWT